MPGVVRIPRRPNRKGGREMKRIQAYESPGITVTFDPNACIHSAVCLNGLPAVFDVSRKRWIRPEAAPPEEVAALVRKCPSGALQFTLPSGDTQDR